MKKVFSTNPDMYKNAYMNWRTDKHQPINNMNTLAEGYFESAILIAVQASKTSSVYKERMKMAQNILSKLQLITSADTHRKSVSTDKFEEIKKYKNLLDEGIISQEEFECKKKELLNL